MGFVMELYRTRLKGFEESEVEGYDGATLADDYQIDADGARKWRALAHELQSA